MGFYVVGTRRGRGDELSVFGQRLQAVMELRRQCLRVNFVVREVDLLWQADFVFSGECMRRFCSPWPRLNTRGCREGHIMIVRRRVVLW